MVKIGLRSVLLRVRIVNLLLRFSKSGSLTLDKRGKMYKKIILMLVTIIFFGISSVETQAYKFQDCNIINIQQPIFHVSSQPA